MRNNEFISFPVQAMERHFSPPYNEAMERLRRMEIIDDEGAVQMEGIRALCVPLGATLYDNLLESGEDILDVSDNLINLYCNGEITGIHLYICLLYSLLDEAVPEPLQWVSAHQEALQAFCELLIGLLLVYLTDDGFLEVEDSGEPDQAVTVTAGVPDTKQKQF